MAGYYDPNKDYSKELQRTDLTSAERSQLEQERQNKINDKYGGNEPTMYGSNQKYSDVKNDTSDTAKQTINNAVQTSSKVNGYDYTGKSEVSTDNKDYTTIGSPNQFGGILAGIPRDAANANKKVKMGNYTVTFNELGQAVSARQDGGASATDSIATTHANDTVYHKLAYDAAAKGEWDLVGQYLNLISETYGRTGTATESDPGLNLKAANLYQQELQNQFGYDDVTYYNKRYDEAYGENAAAVYDATGGAFRTYADLVNAVGAEKAKEMVKNQIATNPSVYQAVSGVKETANPQFGADSQSLLESLSASYGGNGNGMTTGSNYDLSELIRSQKEAELEAKLASLKGAFDKSESALDDALDRLPQEYDNARNEVAAQYAIAQRAFDERAVASGLNTGTSGQAALARSSVKQRSLAEIAQNQANAASDIELQRAQLVAEYEAAITEALAEGEAELAALLYEEMVRVQNLEREDALLDAERETAALELAMEYAEKMGGSGSGSSSASSSGASTSKKTGSTKTATTSQTVNNGGLSTSQIKELQNHYGVTADGLWGPASSKAAGGKSATEAWAAYQSSKGDTSVLSTDLSAKINALGIGPASATTIDEIAAYGGITELPNGSLVWTTGWTSSNYKRKLAEAKQRVIEVQKYLNESR